jgi:hypothetical protein
MPAIRRRRVSRFVACYVAALALALAACGGGSKSSSCDLPEESAGAPGVDKDDAPGSSSELPQVSAGSAATAAPGAAGSDSTASEATESRAGSGSGDSTEPDAGETAPGNTETGTALPELDVVTFPEVGSTEFETATEEQATNSSSWSSKGGATTGASATDSAGTAAPAEEQGANAGTGDDATSVTREIVEADIVQMNGSILYVLNSYRGLVLIDMSDPDKPFVSGRVPFQATPVDMYLRDGRAYIVMSDYFTYWQFDDDSDPLGFHGSRILVVDVDDPTNPQSITGYNIDGEVTDTRIVGDVLYAVSHRNPDYWRYDTDDWEDTTWVLSINIADPDNIREVDRETFPGASQVIQVFPNSISVAAVDADGNPKKYHVRYFVDRIDVSDPDKPIQLDKVNIPGVPVDVDESGKILYSVDYQWDDFGRRRNSFNVLNLSDDTAELLAVLPVGDEIGRARYMDRVVWLASHRYPWYGLNDDSVDSRQPYTKLTRVSVDDDGIVSDVAADVSGYHFDLLDVEDNLAYLASSYPTGLLVLDVSDMEAPSIVSAARTVGYVSKIVRHGDALYMPMGPYGVRTTPVGN